MRVSSKSKTRVFFWRCRLDLRAARVGVGVREDSWGGCRDEAIEKEE